MQMFYASAFIASLHCFHFQFLFEYCLCQFLSSKMCFPMNGDVRNELRMHLGITFLPLHFAVRTKQLFTIIIIILRFILGVYKLMVVIYFVDE